MAALLLLLGASCVGTGESRAPQQERELSDWLMPSALLAQQIEDEVLRLPWTHGIEHLEQIRWFASVGEPAYEHLLRLACDEREKVASAALAALGATGDGRLVMDVQALECWSTDSQRSSDLGLERARTLVRLGDWSAIPTLIHGLASERERVRVLCDQALYEATQLRFGYDPRAAAGERVRALREWEAWWLARSGEGLLLSVR